MDITKLVISGPQDIDLKIKDAVPTDSYILLEAVGLGPPEVNVSIVDTINLGSIYQNSRAVGREVVITIKLNPDYSSGETVESLRSALYVALTPLHSDPLYLKLVNGVTTLAQQECYVKRFEFSHFAKDPIMQITFACVGTFFKSPTIVSTVPVGSNFTIDNIGDAPTGFVYEATITEDSATAFVLTKEDSGTPNKFMSVDVVFVDNDIVIIDTRPGSRKLELIRSSVSNDVIWAMALNSTWLELSLGLNEFTVTGPTFTSTSLEYYPNYWGV